MGKKSDDIDDVLFLVENSVNHILEDLETHIKYGQDFNYIRDMQQIESLVLRLSYTVKSLKERSAENGYL